ncbi:MAG: hypothetical protein HYX27_16760 [Acidobacteria bacterium]|nr:hypothetical protein [Acidobacteriota bacterium]
MPSFKTKFAKAAVDSDFGDFIEEHAGEKVKLDLQWERGAFDGASEKDFQFFVLFESCGEALEKGEKPTIYNCSGTEYNVPKVEGKALITEDGGVFRLRGVFEPSERTGPLQGLFAVELAPAT